MPSKKKYTVKNRIKIKGKTMKKRNTRKNNTRKNNTKKIRKRLLKFPKAFLKKIKKKSSPSPEECPICYEPMTKENTQKLNCGHKFHKKCIKKWKRNNTAKCPMCRGSIQTLSPESQISSIASNGSHDNFIDLGDISDDINFDESDFDIESLPMLTDPDEEYTYFWDRDGRIDQDMIYDEDYQPIGYRDSFNEEAFIDVPR